MNETDLIKAAMRALGKRKSQAKADAARKNGHKGGRPKNPKK